MFIFGPSFSVVKIFGFRPYQAISLKRIPICLKIAPFTNSNLLNKNMVSKKLPDDLWFFLNFFIIDTLENDTVREMCPYILNENGHRVKTSHRSLEHLKKSNGENPNTPFLSVQDLWTVKLKIWIFRSQNFPVYSL